MYSGNLNYNENENFKVVPVNDNDIGDIIVQLSDGQKTEEGKSDEDTKIIIPGLTPNPEDGNTGDGNTGDGNTEDGNTGDGNTEDGNIGDGDIGDGNTGDGNTEDGKPLPVQNSETTITSITSDGKVDKDRSPDENGPGILLYIIIALSIILAGTIIWHFLTKKKGETTQIMDIPEIPKDLNNNNTKTHSPTILPKAPKRHKKPGEIELCNIQGIGARKNQQDSFATSDINDKQKGFLAIVADGMGGLANGAEMSKIVTSNILSMFREQMGISNPSNFLNTALMTSQNKVRNRIAQLGGEMSGSTAMALYVKNNQFYFISVGDSRICLLRDGELILVNQEHNFGVELDEKVIKGDIPLSTARSEPKRGSLTSYIGTPEELLIDRNIKPITLLENDVIIMMSDGVFGTLRDMDIITALNLDNINDAGKTIENAIKTRNKRNQDNFTAIILRF
jgi:protein phosphatase